MVEKNALHRQTSKSTCREFQRLEQSTKLSIIKPCSQQHVTQSQIGTWSIPQFHEFIKGENKSTIEWQRLHPAMASYYFRYCSWESWGVYYFFHLSKEVLPRFLSRAQFLRQLSTALFTVALASRISTSVNLCSTIPIGPGWRTWITVSTSCSTCLISRGSLWGNNLRKGITLNFVSIQIPVIKTEHHFRKNITCLWIINIAHHNLSWHHHELIQLKA